MKLRELESTWGDCIIAFRHREAKGINGEGRQKNNHPFSYDMCARGWIKLTIVVVSSYICCIYTRWCYIIYYINVSALYTVFSLGLMADVAQSFISLIQSPVHISGSKLVFNSSTKTRCVNTARNNLLTFIRHKVWCNSKSETSFTFFHAFSNTRSSWNAII